MKLLILTLLNWAIWQNIDKINWTVAGQNFSILIIFGDRDNVNDKPFIRQAYIEPHAIQEQGGENF